MSFGSGFLPGVDNEYPNEMSVIAGLLTLHDGIKAFAFVVGWMGDIDEGLRVLEPLRNLKEPMPDLVKVIPYTQLQKSFDAGVPHGILRYNKIGYLPDLNDKVIDIVLRHTEQIIPLTVVLFNCMKGAVGGKQ